MNAAALEARVKALQEDIEHKFEKAKKDIERLIKFNHQVFIIAHAKSQGHEVNKKADKALRKDVGRTKGLLKEVIKLLNEIIVEEKEAIHETEDSVEDAKHVTKAVA